MSDALHTGLGITNGAVADGHSVAGTLFLADQHDNRDLGIGDQCSRQDGVQGSKLRQACVHSLAVVHEETDYVCSACKFPASSAQPQGSIDDLAVGQLGGGSDGKCQDIIDAPLDSIDCLHRTCQNFFQLLGDKLLGKW